MAALRFRAKASRSPYTRAGLALSATAWSSEFTLDDIGVSRMGILAGDPIVTLQGSREPGVWETIPATARAEFASAGLQVVDPEPTAEGGPSWADVEAVRREADALQDEVVELRGRVAEQDRLLAHADSLIKGGEEERTRIEARAAEKIATLQKQVDGLKAGLAAAKAKGGKAKPTETGPVDPPPGDSAT